MDFEVLGFSEDEIKEYNELTPEEIKKFIEDNSSLVSNNIRFLKDLGIITYKEIFINYPDMFLMDVSNFEEIFTKYEKEELVNKLNTNYKIVKML